MTKQRRKQQYGRHELRLILRHDEDAAVHQWLKSLPSQSKTATVVGILYQHITDTETAVVKLGSEIERLRQLVDGELQELREMLVQANGADMSAVEARLDKIADDIRRRPAAPAAAVPFIENVGIDTSDREGRAPAVVTIGEETPPEPEMTKEEALEMFRASVSVFNPR